MYIKEDGIFEEEMNYTKSLILPLLYVNPTRFEVEQAWISLNLERVAIKMPYKFGHTFITKYDHMEPHMIKRVGNMCFIEASTSYFADDIMLEIEKITLSNFSTLNSYARRMIVINRGELPDEFNKVKYDDFCLLLHKNHPASKEWFIERRLRDHMGIDLDDIDFNVDDPNLEYLKLFTKEEFYTNIEELLNG